MQEEVFNVGDKEGELTFALLRYERCKSHTFLITTKDAKKAKLPMTHKRVMEYAMAKASVLWNKCQYPKSDEVIKNIVG